MVKCKHRWQFECVVRGENRPTMLRYFCTKCWAKTERVPEVPAP